MGAVTATRDGMRALGLLFLALLGGCREEVPNGPPDVLLITVDTLRRDHVGLYGYERDTTPEIDRFFADGWIFSGATSPSPCTIPAVLQLLTGALDFDERRPRIAEVFAKAGYRTAAVVSQRHFRDEEGAKPVYARGFGHFDVQEHAERSQHGLSLRVGETVTEGALRWLEQDPGAGPSFLWLHYFDPHDTYTPPERHRVFPGAQAIDGDRRSPMIAAMEAALESASEEERRRLRSRPNNHAWFGEIFSEAQVAGLRSLYDAEIRYTDEQIGRVLDAVEKRGRPTVVALTSDHGERLGEENRWDHCQSLHGYEIDVPLLLSVPGAEGGTDSRSVSILDLGPTLFAAAGFPPLPGLDGANLLAQEETGAKPRMIFTRWKNEAILIDGPWKLRVSPEGQATELYHLQRDPSETDNLAHKRVKRTQRMVAEMRLRLEASLETQQSIEGVFEQLEAIGYVQ